MDRLYFIVFEFLRADKDGSIKDKLKANCELKYEKPISSYEDIKALENKIENMYRENTSNLGDDEIIVTILNWKRFE